MLVAFLDESGSHDATGQLPGSEVCGIGGGVARIEIWDRIEAKWLDVLKRYQVPISHLAECDSLKGRFHDWSRIQADSLIHELLDCFCGSPIFAVCGSVAVRDYDQILPSLFKETVVRHPYHCAIYACVGQILERLPTGFNETVAFVMDQQKEFADYAREGFTHLKAETRDPRIGSITYSDRATDIPLQVADVIANVMTRDVRLQTRRPGPPEQWMRRLLRHPHISHKHFEAADLMTFVSQLIAVGAEHFPPQWN